jgi:hypothetical protein
MKLTDEAIKKINTPVIRRELSALLKCTEQTVIRYIHKNENNSPLTLYAALMLIEHLTNMAIHELLELKQGE